MLLDRARHFLRIALGLGVVAPHDTLQLGELAHHRRQEVRLGEPGRRDDLGAGADALTDRGGERLQPRCLIGVASELGLERDAAQLLGAHREGNLAILRPEKGGIAQTRPDDPLIALAHLRRIAALDVAHRDEAAGELAAGSLDGKIALVVLNGRDHHFARQLEEARLESAHDRNRPFDQCRDFLEELGLDQGTAAGRRQPPR